MYAVGLTGGIATGKSFVLQCFKELGAYSIETDMLAHEALHIGTECYQAVVAAFGTQILANDLSINRKLLGAIVFKNPQLLQKLNAIVHPEVMRKFDLKLAEFERAHVRNIIICEVPLLYELQLENRFKKTIVVYIPIPLQVQRLLIRDKCSPEEAQSRIASQLSIETKKALADIVIDNSGSIPETKKQIECIYRGLYHAMQEEAKSNDSDVVCPE